VKLGPTHTLCLRCLGLGLGQEWDAAWRGAEFRIQILFGPFYESLYVNPKESKEFTSGARPDLLNPGVAMNTKCGIAHVG